MKYFLAATFAASAMLFCACGDDSSSNATGNNENTPISISTEGTYSIDKEKKMLVMTPNDSISACFMENGGPSWKTLAPDNFRDSIEFELAGDTLILYNSRYGTTGKIYVGNNKGKIEGTWTSTGCDYDKDEQQTTCGSAIETTVWTFSNGKFKKKNDVFLDKILDNLNAKDFTNSATTYELYRILTGDNDYTYPFYVNIFDLAKDDIPSQADIIDRYNVKIIESTKKSQTFAIDEITYTFKINNTTKSVTEDGRVEAETGLEVSRDSITCVYHYTQKAVNKGLCTNDIRPKAGEYIGSFAPDSWKKKTRFQPLDYYMLDNHKAFIRCLESIDIRH